MLEGESSQRSGASGPDRMKMGNSQTREGQPSVSQPRGSNHPIFKDSGPKPWGSKYPTISYLSKTRISIRNIETLSTL